MAQCAQLQILYEETRSKQNTPKKGLTWKKWKGHNFFYYGRTLWFDMKRLLSFVVYPCTTLLRVLYELVLTGKRQSWNSLALLFRLKPNFVHQSARISSNAYRCDPCDTGFQERFPLNTLHKSKQVSPGFGKNWYMGHWQRYYCTIDFTLKISALVFFFA